MIEILRVVVGSRAYGLHRPESDHDRRGIFVAPTRAFWTLAKPPTHLDGPREEQFSWEIERFCTLALQANPTVLEVLWSPLIETITDQGETLRAARRAFLSSKVAETYGGYARDQLTKVANRRDRTGETNFKQAMHMIRLLLAGTHTLRTGEILVNVEPHRNDLLAIRQGRIPWPEIADRATALQTTLTEAAATTHLPPEPDTATIDQLLIAVREQGLT